MKLQTNSWPKPILLGGIALMALLVGALVFGGYGGALAQAPESPSEAAPAPTGEAADTEAADDEAEEPAAGHAKSLNLFSLILDGGWFMLPIGILSMVVVTFTIERFIALRRNKVMPDPLVSELGRLASSPGGFDPRKAYRICQQHPSTTASVIRTMLLKVGRPHSEVEHSVRETSEREAERLYGNVRWINLAAAVAPLMGLLGTVWGMIQAFHDTTNLAPGQNKAEFLAGGIYVALVTTLGGLCVAIPAAIFAHFFEGRIQKLFHEIDELLFNLLPQIERYEGRVRFSRNLGESEMESTPEGEAKQEGEPVAADSEAAASSS